MPTFWSSRRHLRSRKTQPQVVPEPPQASDRRPAAAPAVVAPVATEVAIVAAPPDTLAALSYVGGGPSTASQWLAALAELEEVSAYKRLSYDLLGIEPEMNVLELGCGIGDDAYAIAQRLGPKGTVTAVDADPKMIEAATAQQRDDTEASARVRFRVADAAQLPFEESAFDAVRIDRMLQHVDDPAIVMAEVARVLRPGGVVVAIEPDWKTMAIYPGSSEGGDDDHTVATIFQWHCAHTPHPLMGRQLRAVLAAAGLQTIEAHPVAYATTRFALADLVLELSIAARAAAGEEPPLLPSDEVERWIAAAQDADAAGRFFAIVPITFARAVKKPDEREP
jgi:ubiquinone/menaquinone biosynthesis C-methylase UbiE